MQSKQYREVVVKYCLAFIVAIICFWLLYYVTAWSLYGIANLTNSESLMHWLADNNHFEAAKESPLNESYIPSQDLMHESNTENTQSIGNFYDGVDYLNMHDVWIKEEMDSIPCLHGLFDELNEYELERIRERDALIAEVPILRDIVSKLLEINESGKEFTQTYNKPGDNLIRPRLYIRKIERVKERNIPELTPLPAQTPNKPENSLENSDVRW